jgi:hypothetical protein
MYKEEVIHFIGGMNEYLGVMDQTEHSNGKGWYRILDACHIGFDPERKATRVTRLGGPKHVYRSFVDIYIPPDSIMEVRALDKKGELYNVWRKAITQPKADRIVLPEGVN